MVLKAHPWSSPYIFKQYDIKNIRVVLKANPSPHMLQQYAINSNYSTMLLIVTKI